MTDYASGAEQLAKAAWLPAAPWSGKTRQLRQGDLFVGYCHQLRSERDTQGPGPPSAAAPKVPSLGEYEDHPIEIESARLTLRTWRGWMMLLEQSCEIAQKDPHDSRLLIAPVVFRKHWDGPFWKGIRSSAAPGLLFLPPMTTTERERYDVRGWPLNTDAAVVLESTTCVSRELVASGVAFGLSGQMRAVLQAKLAEFWSVRGWMRSGHRDTLVGKRIIEVLQTYEQFTGPGRLYKAILEDDSGEDEATVGLVLSP